MTEHDLYHRGLALDVLTLMDRRRILKLAAGAGVLALAGCGADKTATTAAQGCEAIPAETAGPFPGNGSNGPDILSQSGVVRSDIRSSIGSAKGTAAGIPLTVTLTLQQVSKGCAPYGGATVYLWHADQDGRYSMYDLPDQNYLRGVQAAGADGKVTFTTVFPGCYDGRWPHMHFEVYPTLAAAASSGGKVATSQLALPKAACEKAYTASGYEQSVNNLTRVSLDSDNVFSDGYASQLPTHAGSTSAGFTIALNVPV